LYVIRNIYPD